MFSSDEKTNKDLLIGSVSGGKSGIKFSKALSLALASLTILPLAGNFASASPHPPHQGRVNSSKAGRTKKEIYVNKKVEPQEQISEKKGMPLGGKIALGLGVPTAITGILYAIGVGRNEGQVNPNEWASRFNPFGSSKKTQEGEKTIDFKDIPGFETAVKNGDVEKVKEILKTNKSMISGKTIVGFPPEMKEVADEIYEWIISDEAKEEFGDQHELVMKNWESICSGMPNSQYQSIKQKSQSLRISADDLEADSVLKQYVESAKKTFGDSGELKELNKILTMCYTNDNKIYCTRSDLVPILEKLKCPQQFSNMSAEEFKSHKISFHNFSTDKRFDGLHFFHPETQIECVPMNEILRAKEIIQHCIPNLKLDQKEALEYNSQMALAVLLRTRPINQFSQLYLLNCRELSKLNNEKVDLSILRSMYFGDGQDPKTGQIYRCHIDDIQDKKFKEEKFNEVRKLFGPFENFCPTEEKLEELREHMSSYGQGKIYVDQDILLTLTKFQDLHLLCDKESLPGQQIIPAFPGYNTQNKLFTWNQEELRFDISEENKAKLLQSNVEHDFTQLQNPSSPIDLANIFSEAHNKGVKKVILKGYTTDFLFRPLIGGENFFIAGSNVMKVTFQDNLTLLEMARELGIEIIWESVHYPSKGQTYPTPGSPIKDHWDENWKAKPVYEQGVMETKGQAADNTGRDAGMSTGID